MKAFPTALMGAIMLTSLSAEPSFAQGDVAPALASAIAPCWIPPIKDEVSPAVQVRFTLDTTGELVGKPEIIAPSDDPFVQSAEAAAVRALQHCAPFDKAASALEAETQITVNFSLSEFSASSVDPQAADEAELIEITKLTGISLRSPIPEGLCYVDSRRSHTEADYASLMSQAMPGNSAIAFFLDCSTVKQLAAGNEDFDLPRTYVVLSTDRNGRQQRFPERSLEQAITQYEELFAESGVVNSQIENELRDVEEKLRDEVGVSVRAGRQQIVRTDEFAVYTLSSTRATAGDVTLRSTAIGAFTQLFDAPLTVSLYTDYAPDTVPVLLENVAELVAIIHSNSTVE